MENEAAHFMVSTQVSFTSEKDIYLDSNGWRLCLLQRALDNFLPQRTRVLFNTGFFIDSEGGRGGFSIDMCGKYIQTSSHWSLPIVCLN